MNAIARWTDTISADSRVLLIVNSQPFRRDEIEQTIAAIAARTDVSRVSCIAPASLRSWLIQHGLSAANILPARLHGMDVDLVFFLETPRAIRWAAERNATVVLGSEPYAPNNEEVKDAFELRAAALLGAASYVAHSLPDDRVFGFDVKELWMRTARHESMAQHHARVQAGMAALERAWQEGAPPDGSLVSGEMVGQGLDPNLPVIVDASKHTYERLSRALAKGCEERHGSVRILVSPTGSWPSAKGFPATTELVTPSYVAPEVRLHGVRLAIHGVVEGAYSRLIVSPPTEVAAGDAVVAEGKVYQGGVTIGLIRDSQWVSRVDVDEPGSFMAAAVAPGSGLHTLCIANCMRGEDRRNSVALHRYGWARQDR